MCGRVIQVYIQYNKTPCPDPFRHYKVHDDRKNVCYVYNNYACLSLGKLQHVYTELPFSSAICAMAYHPTEHMLAVSSFGSHQPLVVRTHVSHRVESEGTRGKHHSSTANSVANEQESEVIMGQDSMLLHLDQRLREVTKTLNRSIISGTANERTKIRKK